MSPREAFLARREARRLRREERRSARRSEPDEPRIKERPKVPTFLKTGVPATSIQFVVGAQKDFLDPIPHGSDPPNRFHLGNEAIMALRGNPARGEPDWFVETASHFLDDRLPGADGVRLVLSNYQNDEDCPAFAQFGRFCLAGSQGANLIGRLEMLKNHPRCSVLPVEGINPASTEAYIQLIDALIHGADPDSVRVGVYGIWSDLQVEYLLVALRTYYPRFSNVAVCQPLCASPDANAHFQAMSKFHALGFTIVNDLRQYCQWMGLPLYF